MNKRYPILLYLVGIALSIAQFLMIRDFVSILYGEEVVIVLVTASFFLGLSVGYALALRLSDRVFRGLFIGSLFLHLTFPFSYRYLAAYVSQQDLDGFWYIGLLLTYALVFNTIFATFLPRLISQPAEGGRSENQKLRSYYGVELAGFMSGFVVVIFSWNNPLSYLLIPYWLILGAILHLTLLAPIVTSVYAVLAVGAAIFANDMDFHSTAMLYEHKHSIRNAKVLFSVNSPYQKVEVIENSRGERYLYLDGLQNLNSGDLEHLNHFIAKVPAILIKPEKTLLIGNGTLSSVSKVYPYSGHVTSVELDPGVLEAGRRFFTDPKSLEGLDRWDLHVDDGKHFLGTTKDRYDLVVVDVPSPLTIQEAYLHSVEFYALVNERLTDRGVIAVQLSGPLQTNNRSPARIAAALRKVFPEVVSVTSKRADRGFAYASRSLPFTSGDLRTLVREYDEKGRVIIRSQVDKRVSKAVPLSVDTMDLVLRRGWERFSGRYLDD